MWLIMPFPYIVRFVSLASSPGHSHVFNVTHIKIDDKIEGRIIFLYQLIYNRDIIAIAIALSHQQ